MKERFADVCRVILTTGEFLNVSCSVPDKLPNEWLSEFKKRQLVTKIGANHLIIRPYLDKEVRVELESEIGSSDKEKWQSQMENLRLKDFSFSTLGIVLGSDKIFDLTAADNEAEEAFSPVAKKCPNCEHKLSKEEIENTSCDECGNNFWVCPRCDALISEDPGEAESCPICKRTYTSISCPDCPGDVWVDEPKCPKCGKEFKISKCPNCREKFIVSDDLSACPYCGDSIYICPRCQEYIDSDPDDDDTDSCPVCKKTLVKIDCPNCSQSIFPDSANCENCKKEFRLGKCPESQCGEPIILSEDITECPYCQTDIKFARCPKCQEEFYIETN